MKGTRKNIEPARLTESVMRRLWSKTVITSTGCIEWTGAIRDDGYGVAWFEGSMARAHRLTLAWSLGSELPPRDVVDHLCRNRACVRPDHLEMVTRRENLARGVGPGSDAIRLADKADICKRGHDLTAPDAWRSREAGRKRTCRLCDNERVLNGQRRRRSQGKAF